MDEFKIKFGVVRGTDVSSSGPIYIIRSAMPCSSEMCFPEGHDPCIVV